MNFLWDVRDSPAREYTQNASRYEIERKDVRNVTMAGLMHDLGHGPFSHLFDRGVVPTLLDQKGLSRDSINNWEHEDASEMLFGYMIDKYNLDIENDELDQKFICRLI